MPVTGADLAHVRGVLNKMRYEPLEVLDRCAAGHPRVVLAIHGSGGASATVFWLCCVELLAQVSRLEAGGGIRRVLEALRGDESLWGEFLRSQELYRRLARVLFRTRVPALEVDRYLGRVRGVGGVSNAEHLKCLHAQVAFSLATGRGPAGALALRELGFTQSSDGRWHSSDGRCG